jgi:hypothetical protein
MHTGNGKKYFYKGFTNSLLNIALFRSTFTGIYDTLKLTTKNTAELVSCAYLASITAAVLAHPLDLLRRRSITINST